MSTLRKINFIGNRGLSWKTVKLYDWGTLPCNANYILMCNYPLWRLDFYDGREQINAKINL